MTKIPKKNLNKRISNATPSVAQLSSKDRCPTCGSTMTEASGKLEFPVNGEEMTVPKMSFLKCSKCDEIVLRLDETRKLREQAIELYRNKYHLLSGEEIRSLRERLGLTQTDLSELLRLGQNTLSRWESGRNVQASAMDVLLRLIRDVPGALEYLRKLAA